MAPLPRVRVGLIRSEAGSIQARPRSRSRRHREGRPALSRGPGLSLHPSWSAVPASPHGPGPTSRALALDGLLSPPQTLTWTFWAGGDPGGRWTDVTVPGSAPAHRWWRC